MDRRAFLAGAAALLAAPLAAEGQPAGKPSRIVYIGNTPFTSGDRMVWRPGGNVTGLSNQLEDTVGKRLEVLREIIPSLSRLAVVFNPNNSASHTRVDEALGAQAGIKIIPVPFRAPADLEPALATITRERVEWTCPGLVDTAVKG